jgi:hypothetical protein
MMPVPEEIKARFDEETDQEPELDMLDEETLLP